MTPPKPTRASIYGRTMEEVRVDWQAYLEYLAVLLLCVTGAAGRGRG